MIVYLDTSILLRRLLGQPKSFAGWGDWTLAATSELTRVESLRTIDRLRLQGKLTDEEVAASVQGLDEILSRVDEISLGKSVLRKASLSYATVIGTLDAIHLASALLWQENSQPSVVFLTHDIQLGRAAEAAGMKSFGFLG